MELSKKDRWLLSNQYHILEKLDTGNLAYYSKCREVVENGYELDYGWITGHIVDPIAPEACREVVDILEMYDFLQRSYDRLEDKEGIEEWMIEFQGFDGNNEPELIGYAEFIMEKNGQFQSVRHNEDLNSHMPSISRYRDMLQKWKASPNKHNLSKTEIIRITSA